MIENDRLLDQLISRDIVNIAVNSSLDENTYVNVNSFVAMNDSVNYVEICNKCLELEAELIKQHNMVEKDEYNRLLKRFSKLKQHCISLEIAMQLNKEIFQKTNTSLNQTEPSFDQLFELNNLKAELQAKDTIIKKLKAYIKRVNGTSTSESAKKDFNEIETINIELEHRVTKLTAENEHLKQTYKQLYDSIKPSRVCAKEQTESLVNQVNQKSVEISDLNAQLQEKVFVITALKNDLRKLKGKEIADNAAQMSNAATIALGMYKLDPVILAPKLIQELRGYVRDTCPDIHKARVNPSTSASGSKPSSNTKNDRILNSDSKNVYNKHVKHPVKGAKALCSVCNECLFDANHAMCLIDHVNSMNVCAKSASKKNKKRKEWKPTGKVFNPVRYKWKPTRRTFTLVGNACPLTRLTTTNKVPLRVPILLKVVAPKHVVTRVYTRRAKVPKSVQNSKPKVEKSMTANKMKPGTSRGSDTSVAPSSSSLINCRLSKLFCDLKVAFRKYTCFVRNLEGVDLLSGSQGTNLLVRGLPRLKFEKDHLCSACAMDLCGPMGVASVNGKKYILVIVDDYSRFTWVKFLASKDEAPDFIIKFLKMIQIRLNATVRNIRTDNGTEFLTAMASEQSSLEPALHEMTPATPSLVFIPNPPPSASLVPPSRHEWYLVFQPVFDKFFSPLASVASPVLVEEAPAPVESTEESHDLEVAYMSNDPYFGIPIPETVSEESSSSDVIPTTVHSYAPLSKHLSKWTKDHPLQNIIVKPKTYKDALTQSCWIKAMQEELHEFERLEV
ncbi:retrovirus-related pol polyprotein from transposon TNT 1-94 [Tanacetum coccineum]